ncbi:MAG: N-acetylmuramoyl-L-alanine amidase [Candidatus Marisimplicoccus sp.]|jgi:N-acetylmuramoyl-L-alanine amidase|tara:strand:+ start:90 stop:1133 length:1044 start_codon:yes stop_codon:yes gene_type:complete
MNSFRLVFLLLFLSITNFIFSQQNLNSQFTVVVDAGHGGKDPGNTGNGYLEKKIALSIALKLGKKLEDNGVKVVYTRKSDVFVNLFERANIANSSNAQLFISIHCDSHTSQAYGAGTFVLGLHANQRNFEVAKKENSVIFFEEDYINKYEGFDPNNPESVIGLTLMQEEYLDQSIVAASYIQNSFVNRLKRRNRTVKQAGFIVLKYTYMPSVLVETGFLTNNSEGAYLNSGRGQNEMADAIASAVLEYKNDFFQNLSTINLNDDLTQSRISYRIQIAASTKLLELKPYNFRGLKSVDVVKEGNLYKYLYGKHSTLEDAKKSLNDAKKSGYQSSFIVKLENNKIMSLN